jgi:signal peptidase I
MNLRNPLIGRTLPHWVGTADTFIKGHMMSTQSMPCEGMPLAAGFVAACANVVFPGLGNWLVGYHRRAIVWFVAMMVALALSYGLILVPRTAPFAFLLIALCVLVAVLSVIDGMWCGRYPRRSIAGSPAKLYFAGIAILIVGAGFWFCFTRIATRGLESAGVASLKITTQAMRPTLQPGDVVLSGKPSDLKRWDLVIFHPPGRHDVFTQRVAGLPGEKVEIIDGVVHINDQVVLSPAGLRPYMPPPIDGPRTGCAGHPIHLGPDEYYVLCDNRAVTYDSRSFPNSAPGHQVGAIPRGSILGRVTAIYWPIRRLREIH